MAFQAHQAHLATPASKVSKVRLVCPDVTDQVVRAVCKVELAVQVHTVPKADLDRLASAWTRHILQVMLSLLVAPVDNVFQSTRKFCDK